ncbi:MAG TPA: thioesterase family protein [Thermoanaerobaculia bacterium]|jgi:acyl-CoA thioester hydrolase
MSMFRGTWRDGWHVVPHHVLFRDIDAFGHVNNAVFFTYFEWGRTQLWFELTGGNGALDIGFIVAHAQCDFKQQIRLEEIEIATRIGEMRNSSLDFLCEIRKNNGNDVAATGKVVVVLYDWARRSKVPISEELRRKVAQHAAGTSSDSSSPGAATLPGDRRTP